MPIIKSAKKRVRQAKKATTRNRITKRTLREAIKSFANTSGGTKGNSAHSKAQSALDKAAKKGLVHKNKVARKKRQLAAIAKKSGAVITAKKPNAKKPAVKKAVTKKPAAKKTVKK